jgi:hypothetical protein
MLKLKSGGGLEQDRSRLPGRETLIKVKLDLRASRMSGENSLNRFSSVRPV